MSEMRSLYPASGNRILISVIIIKVALIFHLNDTLVNIMLLKK